MRTGNLFKYFVSAAEYESLGLKRGEFVAKKAKAVRISYSVAVAISLAIAMLLFFVESHGIALFFLVLGLGLGLYLPTILSYRCVVNKVKMCEEYFILFFKVKNEVLWSSVKYKKTLGDGCADKFVILYNAEKKQLISFDGDTVGYHRIAKMVKSRCIKDISKR